MAIFFTTNQKAKKITPLKIGLEKDVQNIFEGNLDEILNIAFLASEYSTSSGGRIDTLGVDRNGSPVILEYKKGQNDNVINQGLSYLRWLLDHKDAFVMLCRKMNIDTNIDWTSPRVICVAESYNKFDLDTVDLLPINIELLRYQLYENDILLVEPEVQRKIKISTTDIFENNEKQKKEFKYNINYTVEDHLKSANSKIQTIFSTLREEIKTLDESIREEAKKPYIAYKITTNFCDIVILNDSLKIFINIPSGELDDPRGIARDLEKPKHIGRLGNGDYEVRVSDLSEVGYVMTLIKQSYTYNK